MPAGIVESAHTAVPVAQHHHRILADLHGQIIARVQQLAVVADEQPVAIPNHVQVDLIVFLTCIELSLQGSFGIAAPQAGSVWCRVPS